MSMQHNGTNGTGTPVRRFRADSALWGDIRTLAMLENTNASDLVRSILACVVRARLRRKLESMPITNTCEGRFTVKLPELVLVGRGSGSPSGGPPSSATSPSRSWRRFDNARRGMMGPLNPPREERRP